MNTRRTAYSSTQSVDVRYVSTDNECVTLREVSECPTTWIRGATLADSRRQEAGHCKYVPTRVARLTSLRRHACLHRPRDSFTNVERSVDRGLELLRQGRHVLPGPTHSWAHASCPTAYPVELERTKDYCCAPKGILPNGVVISYQISSRSAIKNQCRLDRASVRALQQAVLCGGCGLSSPRRGASRGTGTVRGSRLFGYARGTSSTHRSRGAHHCRVARRGHPIKSTRPGNASLISQKATNDGRVWTANTRCCRQLTFASSSNRTTALYVDIDALRSGSCSDSYRCGAGHRSYHCSGKGTKRPCPTSGLCESRGRTAVIPLPPRVSFPACVSPTTVKVQTRSHARRLAINEAYPLANAYRRTTRRVFARENNCACPKR